MIQIAYWTIYAFFGWIIETSYCSFYERKFVKRGFLVGPLIPIYAFGAMGVIEILSPITNDPVLIFLYGVVLTSALEYATSFIMEKIFHMRWWDYSEEMYNIKGRICLKNSIMFGVLSLVVVHWIHPRVVAMVAQLPANWIPILASISVVLVSADTIYSTMVSLKFSQRLQKLGEKIAEDIKKSERSLVERFPNMKHLKDVDAVEAIKERLNIRRRNK